MNNLEDLLSAPDVSVLSKEALSVPREFLRKLDKKRAAQRFYEQPEVPSAFGHLTPTLRDVHVSADADLAELGA